MRSRGNAIKFTGKLISRRAAFALIAAPALIRPSHAQIVQFSGAATVATGGFPNAIVGDPNGRPVMISANVMAYSDAAGTAQQITLTDLVPNVSAAPTGTHWLAGNDLQIDTNNTVLDGYQLPCSVIVGPGVTGAVVSRCHITNNGQDTYGVRPAGSGSAFGALTVSDCLIQGPSAAVILGAGVWVIETCGPITVLRCHIYNVGQGVGFNGNGTGGSVRDCYFHNINDGGFGLHNEQINIGGTTVGITINHNHITGPNGQTATIYASTDQGSVGNVTVNNNLLDGFPQNTMYCGTAGPLRNAGLISAAQNFKITNNKWANTGGQNPGGLVIDPAPGDPRLLVTGNVYYPSLTPIAGM